jgi:hypothetical protein
LAPGRLSQQKNRAGRSTRTRQSHFAADETISPAATIMARRCRIGNATSAVMVIKNDPLTNRIANSEAGLISPATTRVKTMR